MSSKACLLIDGHSVIHAWESLRTLHDQGASGRSAAREQLVREVSAYVDGGGDDAILVFDGSGFKGERQVVLEEQRRFRVLYSESGETADDVIERLARRFASAYEFRVVTADQLEADVVVSAGAFWVSPQQFWDEIERTQNVLSAQLSRRRNASKTTLGDQFFGGLSHE